ncbi:MAG: hypothetical protein JWN94_1389 [Betaproteobacteria bacterium]|nr:hypothetical protein [Betaproteobacteria bacterium]
MPAFVRGGRNGPRFKVGLLGAGYISDAHAKSLRGIDGVEIVAVCDRARDRAAAVAGKYGIKNVYTSLEEMLETGIDTVHVLLPPDLHYDATRRLLEARRNVFLEKPMALSAAECEELETLAVSKNLRLAVNHNFLFLPSYQKMRRDLADGTLGVPARIAVNWMFPLGLVQTGPFNNWILREPQNMFLELGPHLMAFVVDLVGVPDELQVEVGHPLDLPGGNRVYRYWRIHGAAGGTAIDITLSILPGYGDRSVTVYGNAATARCDFARDFYYRDEPTRYGLLADNLLTTLRVAGEMTTHSVANFVKGAVNTLRKKPAANPYGDCIERCIRGFYLQDDAAPDPRLGGRFGVDVVRVCEEIARQPAFEPAANAHEHWAVAPPLGTPTILVIGGTGFIGKYLVKSLAARGYGIRVVTRSASAGQLALAGLPVELVSGDLADPAFIDSALEGIDVVYHLAKADGRNWEDYYQNDVLVTRNIAERALANGVKRFIYTGTIDSYYSADPESVIGGDSPLDPEIEKRNLYGRSKACCEALLLDLHKTRGFPVVIVRPGIVIGKGAPPAHWGVGMFQSATNVQFWGSGDTKLPLVLVEDVAEALVLAMEKEGIEGQCFVATDDPLLTARDYVDIVSRESGTRLRAIPTPIWRFFAADLMKEAAKHAIKHPNRRVPSYRDWDSRSHRARYDNSKTRKVLGWQPAGSRDALVERGIAASVREFMR